MHLPQPRLLDFPPRRRELLAAALRILKRDLEREAPRAINALAFHELRLRRIAREQGVSDQDVGL